MWKDDTNGQLVVPLYKKTPPMVNPSKAVKTGGGEKQRQSEFIVSRYKKTPI